MIPAPFDYAAPETLEEAMALLAQNPDAKALAGGHSLLPVMKLRLSTPSMLVDLRKIQELRGIQVSADGARIGAMTPYIEILSSQELQPFQALLDAVALVGDVQVRNRGTIGGSLAHNDPAADLPAVALALEATIQTTGPSGSRAIPADEFFVGLLETALEPGEIITSVDFPAHTGGSAYVKFENPASGYAIVGIAARVTVGADGSAQNVRVAVTGASDYATRLREVESALEGKPLVAENIQAAAEQAGQGLSFNGDIHASEEYRAHLTRVLSRRALEKAAERARG